MGDQKVWEELDDYDSAAIRFALHGSSEKRAKKLPKLLHSTHLSEKFGFSCYLANTSVSKVDQLTEGKIVP